MINSNYSFSAKLLHELALGSTLIAEASFDIEQTLNKVDTAQVNESPVFVAGLARAGTTILMRTLYQTQAFRSLTYRDMPFVLMPATWAKLSASFRQDMPPTERAHGDSIIIDYDSPEAFEEVFWRIFFGRQYIKDRQLERHELNTPACEQFRQYVGSVLASAKHNDKLRYLSKNNSNLLRLSGIKKAFPDSTIIIPFREPVQHALSLYRQHKNFLSIQGKDKFSLKYMNWLGHYEFGLNHKPFVFSENQMPTAAMSRDSIEYWLAQWINAYDYSLEHAPAGTVFLSYDDLCVNPQETLRRLMASLDVPYEESIGHDITPPKSHTPVDVEEKIMAASKDIYSRLLAAKFQCTAATV